MPIKNTELSKIKAVRHILYELGSQNPGICQLPITPHCRRIVAEVLTANKHLLEMLVST